MRAKHRHEPESEDERPDGGVDDGKGIKAADACQDFEGIEHHISRSTLEASDAKHPLFPAEVV